MRSIPSLAVIALLIGVTVSPGCSAGAVEHGNVAFDVSPGGKGVVFSAADGDLYLFHLESRHVDRLTKSSSTIPGHTSPRYWTYNGDVMQVGRAGMLGAVRFDP